MFRQAVDGVRRLGDQRPVRVVPKPEVTLEIVSEDAEVLAQLSDLVSGVGDLRADRDRGIYRGDAPRARPAAADAASPRRVRGAGAYRSPWDDPGRRQDGARRIYRGLGAQGAAHGAGGARPRSAVAGGTPVLKHAAAQWLSHGHMGGYVLAFATARPADGGAGAMYVLLRRDRRRARFDVLQGAKRRD